MNRTYSKSLLIIPVVIIIGIVALILINRSKSKVAFDELNYLGSPHDRFCYAGNSPTPPEFGNEFNYQFISFTINDDKVENGVILNYPYGTDTSYGSFSGEFNPVTKVMTVSGTTYGEGMLSTESHIYTQNDNSLSLGFKNPDGSDFIVPQVPCDKYDQILRDYYNNWLSNIVNTSDFTRLRKLPMITNEGLQDFELDEINFYDLAVDLDNNPLTEEYILYVDEPVFCNAIGCSLYIVNKKGDVLSEITSAKLPLYTTVIEASKQQSGIWRDLIVYSDGAYRTITHDGVNYTKNPLTAPTIKKSDIVYHPEKYQLLLDYLK